MPSKPTGEALHTNAEQPRLDELNSTISSLNDPNLIATVHFYGFWPFSVNIAGYPTFDAEVRQDLIDTFDRVRNASIANGTPVIIGEYGLLGFDQHVGTIEQGEKLKFFEFLGYYARTNDITTMLWDNGQHLDRNALQWNDPEFFAQVQSSWTTRSGTASSDQVYVADSSPVADQTLTLNLNGTSFQGLRNGGTELANGTDYTVSGDQLTPTASLLSELTGSGGYGVNADLHADFSQGSAVADQRDHLRHTGTAGTLPGRRIPSPSPPSSGVTSRTGPRSRSSATRSSRTTTAARSTSRRISSPRSTTVRR